MKIKVNTVEVHSDVDDRFIYGELENYIYDRGEFYWIVSSDKVSLKYLIDDKNEIFQYNKKPSILTVTEQLRNVNDILVNMY